jgi:tRNA (guanine26-N2/guanine27-N2)-dimethyltransferase
MGMDAEKKLENNGTSKPTSEEKAVDDKTPSDTPVEEMKKFEVVFDEKLGKERDTRKLVRYQLNPRENWGPMNRAKGKP